MHNVDMISQLLRSMGNGKAPSYKGFTYINISHVLADILSKLFKLFYLFDKKNKKLNIFLYSKTVF